MELRQLRYFVAVAEKLKLQALANAGEARIRRATTARSDQQTDAEAAAGLVLLAYELLDAHADTAQLAEDLAYDRSWAVHLDYLRALQRKGREMLARSASSELSCFPSASRGSLDVR